MVAANATEGLGASGEGCSTDVSSQDGDGLGATTTWVQCDRCNKWRRIPQTAADGLPVEGSWFCENNPDDSLNNCAVPQELSNEEIDRELGTSEDEGLTSQLKWQRQRPAIWQLISQNIYTHRAPKVQNEDDIMICMCSRPSDGSPGCGPDCLNRQLFTECVGDFCPCEDQCSNRKFSKRQYSSLEKRRAGAKGFGLYAAQDICEGQFIIEYIGEVLEEEEYLRRKEYYLRTGQRHYYFMNIGNGEVIDACRKGALGRFINHSCEPNCETQKWVVGGELAIGLFATKHIPAGTELTFDYNFERYGDKPMRCLCGSIACRGFVGGNQEARTVRECWEPLDASEDPEPIMVQEGEEGTDPALAAVLETEVGLRHLPLREYQARVEEVARKHGMSINWKTEDVDQPGLEQLIKDVASPSGSGPAQEHSDKTAVHQPTEQLTGEVTMAPLREQHAAQAAGLGQEGSSAGRTASASSHQQQAIVRPGGRLVPFRAEVQRRKAVLASISAPQRKRSRQEMEPLEPDAAEQQVVATAPAVGAAEKKVAPASPLLTAASPVRRPRREPVAWDRWDAQQTAVRGQQRRSEVDRRLEGLIGPSGRLRDPSPACIIRMLRLFNLCDIAVPAATAAGANGSRPKHARNGARPSGGGDDTASEDSGVVSDADAANGQASDGEVVEATASHRGRHWRRGRRDRGPGHGRSWLPSESSRQQEPTPRQRARMADLSLLLDVILKTNSAKTKQEFVRCGALRQLLASVGRSPGLIASVILKKTLRVLEHLPLAADDLRLTRSAHGSVASLLDGLGHHPEPEVRARSLALLKRYPAKDCRAPPPKPSPAWPPRHHRSPVLPPPLSPAELQPPARGGLASTSAANGWTVGDARAGRRSRFAAEPTPQGWPAPRSDSSPVVMTAQYAKPWPAGGPPLPPLPAPFPPPAHLPVPPPLAFPSAPEPGELPPQPPHLQPWTSPGQAGCCAQQPPWPPARLPSPTATAGQFPHDCMRPLTADPVLPPHLMPGSGHGAPAARLPGPPLPPPPLLQPLPRYAPGLAPPPAPIMDPPLPSTAPPPLPRGDAPANGVWDPEGEFARGAHGGNLSGGGMPSPRHSSASSGQLPAARVYSPVSSQFCEKQQGTLISPRLAPADNSSTSQLGAQPAGAASWEAANGAIADAVEERSSLDDGSLFEPGAAASGASVPRNHWQAPDELFRACVEEIVRLRIGKYTQPDHPNRLSQSEAAAMAKKAVQKVVEAERAAFAERQRLQSPKLIVRQKLEENIKEYVRQQVRHVWERKIAAGS